LPRGEGRVQLSMTGKGGKVRQVLVPEIVRRSLGVVIADTASPYKKPL
jgi:hypothetical protein